MNKVNCIVCVINVLFILISTTFLILQSKFRRSYTGIEIFLEISYSSPSNFIIVVSLIFTILSLFGIVAALKESTKLLNTYALILKFLCFLEFGTAVTALLISTSKFSAVENVMENGIRQYKLNGIQKLAWDAIQKELNCCGLYQPYDWASYTRDGILVTLRNSKIIVPFSCCVIPWNCTSKSIYAMGCLQILKANLSGVARVVGYAIFAVVILQIGFLSLLGKHLRRIKHFESMENRIPYNCNLRTLDNCSVKM